MNWTVAVVPFSVEKTWKAKGQLRVRGAINGFTFRTSLFPIGDGRDYFPINKAMQKGAHVTAGSSARFLLTPDVEERRIHISPDLSKILGREPALRRWHDSLSPSARREISSWVAQPQSSAARLRRADQMAERMLQVMEAERELPPILRRAFANDPPAHQGWLKMSSTRRRQHLFAIFGYRSPESQSRRIARMLDDAARRA